MPFPKYSAALVLLLGCSTLSPNIRRSPANADPDIQNGNLLSEFESDRGIASIECAKILSSLHVPTPERRAYVQSLDIKSFSESATLWGQEANLHLSEGDLQTYLRAGEINKLRGISSFSLWDFSLIPFESYRRYAFDSLIEIFSRKRWDYKLGEEYKKLDREGFEALLKTPVNTAIISEVERINLSKIVEVLNGSKTNITPNDAVLTGLCGTYGKILEISPCIRALKMILTDMSPASFNVSVAVTLVDEIADLYRNPQILDGVRRTALKIYERVTANKPSERVLFDDLYSSLLEAGLSETSAYDNAWKVLGVYSTGGANIRERLILFSNDLRSEFRHYPLYFSTIAMGTAVLDARNLEKLGSFYAFPKSISSTVANGKPYHFWMSAYLARKAAIQTGSENASVTAAWLSGLGYQIKSNTSGRDRTRAFITEAFGPQNNKIRLDVAYLASGSVFGARSVSSLSPKTYRVNEGLKAMLLGASNLPILPESEAKKLFDMGGIQAWGRWREIFSPDEALHEALKP